ncbi:hypothetical protein [Streptomyces lydicus]|uniref:Uncharacterized protein n=1 Tax=Streptomyces lydicus TaxID=47763 RepID=A0A1D7VP56_9ACTN|nr:hypothetical protein [Streptomyces lydicus]AOP48537.1 hypothetical protein SL103_21925 [Streptomyces lydicus]
MKKLIATAFAVALFGAGGAGIASAAPATPAPSSGHGITTTFHCPPPRGTFTLTADAWVTGQYTWYYGRQGCTHTP